MQRASIADEDVEDPNEDDYSASACAIVLRRTSTKRHSRRKRRSSLSHDVDGITRRRSSVYTVSSGDSTAISIEETGTQEQVFEKLKLHKEVLSGVRQQPWPLQRKIKVVRQAKSYIRKHEGVLQERLAQNHSTKDVIARISLLITKKWQYFRRELVNLETWLIPWESRIKEIESHFGSAVASYFTFLRWLCWINFVIAATLAAFVAIPEVLTGDVQLAGERKLMLKEESIRSNHLTTLWQFEGVLKYSPFFYGWYTNHDSKKGYRLPLAYFVTNLVIYTYSFVAILRKMAKNSRLSKLTEKEDECAFSWKLFTGWDFMIGNPETAHNRLASIVLGFKEALLEEAEKQKDKRNWKVISMRIFVNVSVISLLALSAYAVVKVVSRSTKDDAESNWWRQNEITIVMSLISYVFPIFFEILGFLENHHPRKQLRMQLARIMVLNLLNLYSLIFALFNKIGHMKTELVQLKPINVSCSYTLVQCIGDAINFQPMASLASLSLLLMSNVTHANIKNEVSRAASKSLTSMYEGLLHNPILSNDVHYADYNSTVDEEYYYGEDNPHMDYDNGYLYENNDERHIVATTEGYAENFNATRHTNPVSSTRAYDNENFSSSAVTIEREDHGYVDYVDYDVTTTGSTSINLEEPQSTTMEGAGSSLLEDSGCTTTDPSTTSVFEGEFTFATTWNVVSIADEISKLSSTMKNNDSGNDDLMGPTVVSTKVDASPVTTQVEKEHIIKCYERLCTSESKDSADPSGATMQRLNLDTRRKLRRLCWETMFGQELAKLTVMDLMMTVVSILGMDFFRALFVRFMNNCWCWDLEKQFPQYGDFKIAENILHLVYNQGMVWMGMFFSPGLTVLNLLKLGILMYLRSWAVLTCNVPHEVVFRASRSNNFYFALLLTMLFLCVLPVGYAVVWVEPSWHCGPFSGYPRIYKFATKSLEDSLPDIIKPGLDYVASASIVIPLIVLMTLIIYYMVSLTGSLREANNDLKIQLRQERTEERRRLFKIVEKRQEVCDTPFMRWRKILPALPNSLPNTMHDVFEDDLHTTIAIEDIVEVAEKNHRKSTTEVAEMIDVEQDSLARDTALPQLHNKSDEKKSYNASHNR